MNGKKWQRWRHLISHFLSIQDDKPGAHVILVASITCCHHFVKGEGTSCLSFRSAKVAHGCVLLHASVVAAVT